MTEISGNIGAISLGENSPVRIQSMTNTDTADIEKTVKQVLELAEAGSEMVRITVDTKQSALAVPEIVKQVREFSEVPIIGDFHFNGHIFLEKYPEMAKAIDKYRINPGNVGTTQNSEKITDSNFERILTIAKKLNKPIRIGVNGGSLDQKILQEEMDCNAKQNKNSQKTSDEVFGEAMVKSAIRSAQYAENFGIPKQNITVSVKHSSVPIMISAYRNLAQNCDYLLHLGLTEAGGGNSGIIGSSIALGTLLQEGIGDTIRVSITPQKGESRTKEVKICQEILQQLGLRNFSPRVVSCPGCGRTTGNDFADMAEKVSKKLEEKSVIWSKKYKKFSELHIAVMGCVVNGVGEAANADIGIFFPGKGEGKHAIISVYGEQKNLTADTPEEIETLFFEEIEKFLKNAENN